MMSPDRWDRIQELFNLALEHPESERPAFLSKVCGEDHVIRREVESLLAADEGAGDFIETSLRQATSIECGESIGPYRVLKELGHGGMGTVYLAERADDEYRKQVAIKVIRLGLQNPWTLARFRAERQILANLEHSNIARLLDGGTTEAGLSYVAMEYVDGLPLVEYADKNNLTVQQRLTLFEKVCAAVQYAHQHLVIHRDIKPGNILVTSEGEPKLLDFGIAKLIAPEGSTNAHTIPTMIRFATPRHASPEQLRGESISTATDVYSLGVLLCELLTGQLPYAGISSEKEIERAICEREPLVPSSLVPLEHRDRRSAMHGDLDNIILMAIRKEPHRRYTSVGHMAEDIRRHSSGYPIHARPDTWRYRTDKFVRRHKAGVAAGVLFVVLLGVFSAGMTLLARRLAEERDAAALERNKAERVVQFLVELFEEADPTKARGNTVTVREVIDKGAKGLENDLAEEPAVRAKLMQTFGRVYLSLALFDRAEPLLQKTLALRKTIWGDQHKETAASIQDVGVLHYLKGEQRLAEPLLRTALDMRRGVPGEQAEVARSMTNLAAVFVSTGDLKNAEGLLRQALEMQQKSSGEHNKDFALTMTTLGQVMRQKADYPAAEAAIRKALEINRALLGEDHPRVAANWNDLGLLLRDATKLAEAEPALQRGLALNRKLLGEDHPRTASSITNLGALLFAQGKYAEAEPLFRESLAKFRARVGDSHPTVALMINNLATLRYNQGDLTEAEMLFREALALNRKHYPKGHFQLADNIHNLGRVLHSKKEYRAAESLVREALAMRRKVVGEKHVSVAISLDSLGLIFRDEKRFAPAETLHLQALVIRRAALQPANVSIAVSLLGVGVSRMELGKLDEAESALREGLALREKALPADHWEVAELRSLLGDCLTRMKRYDEAQALLSAAYPTLKAKRGENHSLTVLTAQRLDRLQKASSLK